MRYAQSSARSSGRSSAYKPNRISQHRTVVHVITPAPTVRPPRKLKRAASTRGVDRIDSLTTLTRCTTRAMHQTGQCPPAGHSALDPAGAGTGSCSRGWLRGVAVTTAGNKDRDWSPDALAVVQTGPMAAEGEGSTATAVARGPNLSFGSFSAPFFPPLPERPVAHAIQPTPLLVVLIAPGAVATVIQGPSARRDLPERWPLEPVRARATCSATAPPRRLGCAAACTPPATHDTSRAACCDFSAAIVAGSDVATSLLRHSARHAQFRPLRLPCPELQDSRRTSLTKQNDDISTGRTRRVKPFGIWVYPTFVTDRRRFFADCSAALGRSDRLGLRPMLAPPSTVLRPSPC